MCNFIHTSFGVSLLNGFQETPYSIECYVDRGQFYGEIGAPIRRTFRRSQRSAGGMGVHHTHVCSGRDSDVPVRHRKTLAIGAELGRDHSDRLATRARYNVY